jgi:hypothetical protein
MRICKTWGKVESPMMRDGFMHHGWMWGMGWGHILVALLAVLILVALIKIYFFD